MVNRQPPFDQHDSVKEQDGQYRQTATTEIWDEMFLCAVCEVNVANSKLQFFLGFFLCRLLHWLGYYGMTTGWRIMNL